MAPDRLDAAAGAADKGAARLAGEAADAKSFSDVDIHDIRVLSRLTSVTTMQQYTKPEEP